MSVDFGAWMGSGVRPIDDSARAVDVWRRIERDPTRVVFTKPKVINGQTGVVTPATALPAQCVRVVADNRATPVEGVAGVAPTRAVVIYGVKGHPNAEVADTDIAVGYETRIDGKQYRVTQVLNVPGGVQALARVFG